MIEPIVLTTARLTLSPLTVDDADRMLAVYSDERMFTYTGGRPPTADELHKRYQHLVAGWNHDQSEQWCNWIVRLIDNPQPIGAMQATVAADLRWSVVAWEIAVGHQGNGYATEAARAIVEWLIAAGVAEIAATIHPEHRASENVAREAGLTPTSELDDGELVWKRTIRTF